MDLRTLDWDEGMLEVMRRPARGAAADRPVGRPRAVGHDAPRRPVRRRDPRLRHASATSTPPSSARPASRPASRRTPTAPAASCCSTPARSSCPASSGLLTTVAYQYQGRAAGLRAGRLDRGRRVARAVAARQPRADPHVGRGRGARRARVDRQRRRLLRPRVLRAVRPVLAERRPRRRRRPDRLTPTRATSPAPCSKPPRTRRATCSTRWNATPASSSPSLRVDGGMAVNDLLMQFQADVLGVPVDPPDRDRDDGPRRRLRRGAGGGLLVGRRRAAQAVARRPDVDAARCPTPTATACSANGARRWSGRWGGCRNPRRARLPVSRRTRADARGTAGGSTPVPVSR